MDNLELYNKVRSVPAEALKKIKGGRLNGYYDINPMWRIKTLTQHFGLCGIGWKIEILKQWLETGANGEISAFCNINLYIKAENGWSEPIPGTGGSSYVAKEFKGMYTSDECYKMALTDAISVACKFLGFAADIYWNNDVTKYNNSYNDDVTKYNNSYNNCPPQNQSPSKPPIICPKCGKPVNNARKNDGTIVDAKAVFEGCGGMCYSCYNKNQNEKEIKKDEYSYFNGQTYC